MDVRFTYVCMYIYIHTYTHKYSAITQCTIQRNQNALPFYYYFVYHNFLGEFRCNFLISIVLRRLHQTILTKLEKIISDDITNTL